MNLLKKLLVPLIQIGLPELSSTNQTITRARGHEG